MKGKITREMFICVPEIDFDYGYKYFFGNMENYKQALLAILKSIKAKLPILNSMVRSEEYEGLRLITQTLSKMMKNIGANNISELSYQLELILLNRNAEELNNALVEYIYTLFEFSEHLECLLKHSELGEEKETSFGGYDFTKTKECLKSSADLLERKIL